MRHSQTKTLHWHKFFICFPSPRCVGHGRKHLYHSCPSSCRHCTEYCPGQQDPGADPDHCGPCNSTGLACSFAPPPPQYPHPDHASPPPACRPWPALAGCSGMRGALCCDVLGAGASGVTHGGNLGKTGRTQEIMAMPGEDLCICTITKPRVM